MESQSEGKTEYELKKQERSEKKESLNKSSNYFDSKKIIGWVVSIIVILLIVWGIKALIDNNSPQGEDFAVAYPTSGRDHIEIGTGSSLKEGTYSSNPPSSGPHYPTTAKTGFYKEPIEDQYAIHNLEHGDIWVAYNPRVSLDVKNLLEKLSGRYVIITPREKNDFDISLVAWGMVDNFNVNDLADSAFLEQRIKDFILRYDNKGPEKVRTASMN